MLLEVMRCAPVSADRHCQVRGYIMHLAGNGFGARAHEPGALVNSHPLFTRDELRALADYLGGNYSSTSFRPRILGSIFTSWPVFTASPRIYRFFIDRVRFANRFKLFVLLKNVLTSVVLNSRSTQWEPGKCIT